MEVICIDDYSEYPVTYRSETGDVVDKIVSDWDSPEALSSKALTEYLSENIDIQDGAVNKMMLITGTILFLY